MRGMGRLRWVASLIVLLALAACGQPEPAPGPGAVAAAANEGPVHGRLLFTRGGNVWLWADGQEARITRDGGAMQPRWSPDGSQMLWVQRGDSFGDLWLADARGGDARPLTAHQSTRYPVDSCDYVLNSFQVSGPSWARLADGSDRIIYGRAPGGRSCQKRLDNTFSLWVASGPDAPPEQVAVTLPLPGHIEGAALSPDGTRVAFAYDTGDPDSAKRTTQLYIADLAAGSYRALTDGPDGAYDPAWSPDGSWIVYAARRQGRGATDLWAMRPDGTANYRLTDGGADRGPAFSPDGNQLAFVRLNGTGYGLFYVDLTAPNGRLIAGKAQKIGEYTDVDPGSGISWAR